jgi:hypothetical protein
MAAEIQQMQETLTDAKKQARLRSKREGRELALAKKEAASARNEASKLEQEQKPLAVELQRMDRLLYGRGGGAARVQTRAKVKGILAAKKGSPGMEANGASRRGKGKLTKC